MRRVTVGLLSFALLAGTGAAASAPEPVETRAGAVLELNAAIEDELRALDLLRKTPPRFETARLRVETSMTRLRNVRAFLATVPGTDAVEYTVLHAQTSDWNTLSRLRSRERERYVDLMIDSLESALERKRSALPKVRAARPPPPTAQCSDGKDNDGDGNVDAPSEPGCTGPLDVRESTRFDCPLSTRMAGGTLAVTGSCSGAFAEIEVTLLDGVRLNGRFDVKHATSCLPPTLTRVRCSTKDGAQNPRHLVDLRIATTSKDVRQRLRLRFFDARKRQVARVVLPPR